jgi:hypothetical protein
MVGLNELVVFVFKDRETFVTLKNKLSGWCFFRNENDVYYMKAPKNKVIRQLIESELIVEQNQKMTEQ